MVSQAFTKALHFPTYEGWIHRVHLGELIAPLRFQVGVRTDQQSQRRYDLPLGFDTVVVLSLWPRASITGISNLYPISAH
jgi:hypothetical protein